ncbi:esterase/lipase [Mycoplasmopsis columbina]|nr:alpha/beta hydrolase [Mycoplasmopsis columbina]VEU76841.1 esterase/lipase [Mycoplasmopsis columbina]
MEKIFEYQNLKLKYLEQNNNQSKNLLYIHGFSSDYKHFYPCYEEFSDFNWYGLNMPAHGESEARNDVMNQLIFRDILIAFINEKQLDNLYIVGHSMGGALAMMLVPFLQEKISKIALVGPQNRSSLSRLEEFKDCFYIWNAEDYKKLVNLCYFDPQKIVSNKELMIKVDNYLKNNKEKLKLIYKLGDNLPELKNMDQIDRGLLEFKKPLALIYGEADGIIDLNNIAKYYRSLKNDTKVYKIEKSGHSIWIENYSAFIDILKQFFDE